MVRGVLGALVLMGQALTLQPAGDGVWGPSDLPIMAGRDMGAGRWPGPAQSSLATQTCPLYPGCFGGVSSPCLCGTVWVQSHFYSCWVSALATPPWPHLTGLLLSPQGEGCNRTARAGLEGQDAPGDRGKPKQRGPRAVEGGRGAQEQGDEHT